MLLRRLQTRLNVRERVELLRSYFAGSRGQPNLQSQLTGSTSRIVCARKPYVDVRKTQQWLVGSSKRYETTDATVNNDANAVQTSENNRARDIIANSKMAPKSIGLPLETIETVSDEEVADILRRDFESSTSDEILNDFRKLSCHAKLKSTPMSEDVHGPILIALTKKLHELDDEKFRRVFQCLALWPNLKKLQIHSFDGLWKKMDESCIERLKDWPVEKALMFVDYWYQLLLARKADYAWVVMKKFGKKPNKLDAINFLHFMFVVNIGRKPPLNMYEMEYRLSSMLDEYTANELGVIALAFFKTESGFRDPMIVTRMQRKVLEQWDDTGDISLAAIMKMTRYSTGLKELPTLCKVFDRVKERAMTMSLLCLTHIAHAAASVQCYDAELMKIIIKRFEDDIDNARLKDLERFCWSLLIFNYHSGTPVLKKVIETLQDPKRQEERAQYPTPVLSCLTSLSHMGVFPIDLIKEYLSPEKLYQMYGGNIYKMSREYFALENNLRIECPEYDGPFLEDHLRQHLAKKYRTSEVQVMQKNRSTSKFLLEVAHLCKSVLGSNTAVHIDQVLPHFVKPDLILCLDLNNNPSDPETLLSRMPAGTIKYAPQGPEYRRWIAVLLATQNQMLTNMPRHIGPLSCKIRQLKKIGYIPLVVRNNEWRLLADLTAKEKYLKNMLFIEPHLEASANAI